MKISEKYKEALLTGAKPVQILCVAEGCGQIFTIGDSIYEQHVICRPLENNPNARRCRISSGHAVCPDCGHQNDLLGRPEISRLKFSFRKIRTVYIDKDDFSVPSRRAEGGPAPFFLWGLMAVIAFLLMMAARP